MKSQLQNVDMELGANVEKSIISNDIANPIVLHCFQSHVLGPCCPLCRHQFVEMPEKSSFIAVKAQTWSVFSLSSCSLKLVNNTRVSQATLLNVFCLSYFSLPHLPSSLIAEFYQFDFFSCA